MENLFTTADRFFAHPLAMLGLAVLLISYRLVQRHFSRLPALPVGFFILYLAIRAIWLVARDIAGLNAWQMWIHLVAAIILAWAIVRLLFSVVVEYILKLRGKPPLPKITRDFMLLACYAIIGLVLLRTLGNVNLAGLITTSAVLTAVVGLAAQSTLSSLFAGLTLQLGRQFNVGDWISLEDYTGQVVGITWKSTLLQTREGETIFIPNSDVTSKHVHNHSRPSRTRLAKLSLGLDYNAAPNRVRQTMLAVLDNHPRVLKTPAPEVRLTSFGDFAIDYEIIFWHDDYGLEPRLKAEINNHLWYALRRAAIAIPFPIRNLQFAHVERRRQTQQGEAARIEMRQRLDQIPVLTPLSSAERDLLSQQPIAIEEFGDGELIVRQGDPGDSLYIILKGRSDVLMAVGEREPTRLATMTAGQFFGEMSLLTGAPRSATVRAQGDTTLLVIDHEDFRAILAANPQIANQLADVLVKRQTELAAREGKVLAEAQSASRLVSKIKAFFGVG